MYEIFEKLCQERRLSMYAVSKATGISQAALSAWKKRPDGMMNATNTKILADYLGVTPDYLITGIDKENETYQTLVESVARNEKRKETEPYEPFIQKMVGILPQLTQEQITEIIHYAEFCLYKNGLSNNQTQTDRDN